MFYSLYFKDNMLDALSVLFIIPQGSNEKKVA